MNQELTRLAIAALRNPDGRFVDEVHAKLTAALAMAMHPGDGYAWTAEDDAVLRANVEKLPYKAIGKRLNRSVSAVRNRVYWLDIKTGKNRPWTRSDVATLQDLGAHAAAVMLGRTVEACKMKLRKLEGTV